MPPFKNIIHFSSPTTLHSRASFYSLILWGKEQQRNTEKNIRLGERWGEEWERWLGLVPNQECNEGSRTPSHHPTLPVEAQWTKGRVELYQIFPFSESWSGCRFVLGMKAARRGSWRRSWVTHKMSHRSSYKHREAIGLPTPTSVSSATISQLPSLLRPLTHQVEEGAMQCL